MGTLKNKFRQIKKLPTWLFFLPSLLLKLWFKLFYRFELHDPKGYTAHDVRGAIGVAWHNRLLFFAPALPRRLRIHTAAVVSASRDGQYVADFISFFGLKALRGSSSRRGANALLGAIHAIQHGQNVAFTPDGPRGPRYTMKPGPIMLASRTGAPIYPISINASSCKSLRGWDGFQIPRLFCKLTLIIGDPITVPPDLNDEELEKWRCIVEQKLRDITIDPA